MSSLESVNGSTTKTSCNYRAPFIFWIETRDLWLPQHTTDTNFTQHNKSLGKDTWKPRHTRKSPIESSPVDQSLTVRNKQM